MSSAVDENFHHIRYLASDFAKIIPGTSVAEQRLNNELAGMFAVTIVATYESIVKNALISYAASIHPKYRIYIEKDFDQINARISLDQLGGYSRKFGLQEWIGYGVKKNKTSFHKILEDYKAVVERRFRTKLTTNYENLITWRNDYAHERTTSVTLNEVYESHRVGQYVVRAFVKALETA